MNTVTNTTGEPVTDLTQGQVPIYDGIVRGYSNKRIAADAGLSEKTVKAHVTAILKKTMHKTRCELIVAHYTHGTME